MWLLLSAPPKRPNKCVFPDVNVYSLHALLYDEDTDPEIDKLEDAQYSIYPSLLPSAFADLAVSSYVTSEPVSLRFSWFGLLSNFKDHQLPEKKGKVIAGVDAYP